RRDESGGPTGILHEAAARLVMDRVPPPTADEVEASIVRLARELVRLGIVAVHDPGALSLQDGLGFGIAGYRALDERDGPPPRGAPALPRLRAGRRGAGRGAPGGRPPRPGGGPGAVRLAEALRRRHSGLANGRAARADRAGGGPTAAARHGARHLAHATRG